MSIRLPMDTRPLRDGRELRLLLGGRAISALGSAVTMVAAALQAYRMTHVEQHDHLYRTEALMP